MAGALDMIHYMETKYGFEFGSAKLTRLFSHDKTGAVVIEVKTPRRTMQISVSRTGLVRIFDEDPDYVWVRQKWENDQKKQGGGV